VTIGTAQKREQNVQDTPVSVSGLHSATIESAQASPWLTVWSCGV
jgi:hypothetical protein